MLLFTLRCNVNEGLRWYPASSANVPDTTSSAICYSLLQKQWSHGTKTCHSQRIVRVLVTRKARDLGTMLVGARGYFVHHYSWLLDGTMDQVVCYRSVSVKAWVQLQERLNGICRVTGAGLSPSFPLAMSFHHCSPHIHSSITDAKQSY